MEREQVEHTNETYLITIVSPLLRPGITISCSVSSKYLVQTTTKLMAMVRQINSQPTPGVPDRRQPTGSAGFSDISKELDKIVERIGEDAKPAA